MLPKSTLALAALVVVQTVALVLLMQRQPAPTPSPPPAVPAVSQKVVSPEWIADRRAKIEAGAAAALAAWLAENPFDREQIEGAQVNLVEPIGPFLYVEMHKDNRRSPDSRVDDAYFHLLLALPDFKVLYQQRGPDAVE